MFTSFKIQSKHIMIGLLLFAWLPVQASQMETKNKEQVALEWVTSGTLAEERKVFMSAFKMAYTGFSLETLKIKSLDGFLTAVFDEEVADVNDKSKKVYFVTARKAGKVVGFAAFDETKNPHEVYIRQLAVDPASWGSGIGKDLIFSILQKLPSTKKFVVMTRKVNQIARKFYLKVGFTVCNFLHEGLDPERYIGYEYTIPEKK